MKFDLLVILGPTAVGKTRLAALLADEMDGEIISADSRQVYKGLNIGAGKDIADYVVNGRNIPYHLIDIIEPGAEYNVFSFQRDFSSAYNKITGSKKTPILAGGTGLYLSAVLEKYSMNKVDFSSVRYQQLDQLSTDELLGILNNMRQTLHNTTDSIERDRIIKAIIVNEGKETEAGTYLDDLSEMKSLIIGINPSREFVKQKITARLKERLECGMIEEVEGLLNNGVSEQKLEFFGLEYRFVCRYLKGIISSEQLFSQLNTAIHQFAKRQMTWFRRMEKHGINIHWIESADVQAARAVILRES